MRDYIGLPGTAADPPAATTTAPVTAEPPDAATIYAVEVAVVASNFFAGMILDVRGSGSIFSSEGDGLVAVAAVRYVSMKRAAGVIDTLCRRRCHGRPL